ncbi:AraC family ligand binding domain-containing protein [Streptomyces sp. NRRL F-5123]|uniref:AraC family ligand binding domain-containing protein n=1 Tax=Streptomyces sp. NRRL F-5123 TaxID=1463856 RepID=UPI001F19D991|nr:AraC family ligand binding domain-containing protein [Streptomyces sp. NRRL F-5123]
MSQHQRPTGGSAGESLEVHALEVADPAVLPFVTGTFDPIGPPATAAFPHRHSFYEIGPVTGGRGAHVVDLTPYDLASPYLYALAPGQVHHWQDAEALAGRVLLFTEDFLLPHPGDAAVVRSLSARPLRPAPDEYAALRALLAELDREYRGAAHGRVSILSSYPHILLLRPARLPGPPARPRSWPTASAT